MVVQEGGGLRVSSGVGAAFEKGSDGSTFSKCFVVWEMLCWVAMRPQFVSAGEPRCHTVGGGGLGGDDEEKKGVVKGLEIVVEAGEDLRVLFDVFASLLK